MENKTYFFQPEKKLLKQGFFMTDEDGTVIYEAKMLKQPLIGAMEFEFTNHLSGRSEKHKVGQTVTSEQTGLLGFTSTKSHFKYDGKKIWDYLHEQGIRINSSIATNKLGMVYSVTLRGEDMATIASAAPNNSKAIVTGGSCYNVTTSEENLDLAFLTAFAFVRTGQAFYS